jgi:hypothetical protein
MRVFVCASVCGACAHARVRVYGGYVCVWVWVCATGEGVRVCVRLRARARHTRAVTRARAPAHNLHFSCSHESRTKVFYRIRKERVRYPGTCAIGGCL